MNIVTKTVTKVVLETTKKEIQEMGFDELWEEVREQFPRNQYSVFSIDSKPNDDELIYIELISTSLEE